MIWTGLRNLTVRNELLYAVNIACVAAMCGFLVDGLNSPSLRNNPCMRVFWVLCGLLQAVRYWRLRNEAEMAAAVEEPELVET
jgi:hypothetical protein